MNCPYCGFNKAKRKKETNFRTYTCPRCDYLFEVSSGRVLLDLALSVPFSSWIYTPVLLVINYFIAKATFNSAESLLPMGVYLMFLLITTALLLLFLFFMIKGRSSRIFIVKAQQDTGFISTIKRIHPLIKMITYLLIASIFAAIFF